MIPTSEFSEPFHVSARFRRTLEMAVFALETAAAADERMVARLENADHRRRQRLLVDGQLERAFELRELLERTVLRPEALRGQRERGELPLGATLR